MNKTLLFFKPVIYRNDVPTATHITYLLDNLINRDPDEILKNVKRKSTSLKTLKVYDQADNNPLDRGFSIAIYREDKPYVGDRRTNDVNEINEDVFELTNCVYFEASRILCIEYNHTGVRANTIKDYLNLFLPKEDNVYWNLEFHQIQNDEELLELRRSMDIRNIKIVLNPEATQEEAQRVLPNANDREDVAIFNTFLNSSLAASRILGGTNEINLKRKGPIEDMNFRLLIELFLEEIDVDGGLFNDVHVTFKPRGLSKVKTISLIQSGYLKFILAVDATGWEYTLDKINETYFENGRIGNNKPSDAPGLQELVLGDDPELL